MKVLVVDEHGSVKANVGYRIKASNGQVWEGIADADGLTQRIITNEPVALDLEIVDQLVTVSKVIE